MTEKHVVDDNILFTSPLVRDNEPACVILTLFNICNVHILTYSRKEFNVNFINSSDLKKKVLSCVKRKLFRYNAWCHSNSQSKT